MCENLLKILLCKVVKKKILSGNRNRAKYVFYFLKKEEIQYMYMLIELIWQRGKDIDTRENF